MIKYLPDNAGDLRDMGSIPVLGRSSGRGHGTSSVLGWRIPWTEKPGRLRSIEPHRVGHELPTNSKTVLKIKLMLKKRERIRPS